MWPFVTDAPSAVQLIFAIATTIIGISHIVRPELWGGFFARLHQEGHAGLVTKLMLVELWPALIIVSLHQVWSGPAIVLTLFGWALLAKVAIGLLVPSLAMRSMAIPQRAPKSFVPAGFAMLALAAASAAALLWRT